ncbi:unnamed protein product [Cutaneotrichosporon oleaginosum]
MPGGVRKSSPGISSEATDIANRLADRRGPPRSGRCQHHLNTFLGPRRTSTSPHVIVAPHLPLAAGADEGPKAPGPWPLGGSPFLAPQLGAPPKPAQRRPPTTSIPSPSPRASHRTASKMHAKSSPERGLNPRL